ncbi:MAG: ABC transporter substrate-binding protein [Spirochaetales bacterium]|nr:ABC transporter substrate-binding protein [Spirochaetales bacterium]
MSMDTIRLLLDWTLDAKHAVFVEGIKKGFYKEAGLELLILEPAQKSSMALERLYREETDLVINYPHNIILMQEQVPGVLAVGSLVQSNPEGLLSLEEQSIQSPADLKGKTIGVGPSPVSQAQLEVFLAQNNLPRDSVQFKIVGFEGEELLLAGEIDLLDAVSYAIPRTLRKGHPVRFLSYTEYGLPDSPFLVFAARGAWAEKNQDLLSRFAGATRRGLETVKNWTPEDWNAYVEDIPTRESGTEEQEVWRRTYPLLMEESLFQLDLGSLENLAAILTEKGILQNSYNLRDLFLNLLK